MLGSGERLERGFGLVLALAVSSLAPACSSTLSEERPSAVSTGTPEPVVQGSDEPGKSSWETCYSAFAPTGDAQNDLAHLTRDCGTTGGMRAITEVKTGTQSAQDPVARYAFQVPAADKCYRVYAVGDSSVKDLDLLLRGPSGDAMVADLTHDSWPVLPPTAPVCFSQAGLYMLEVSVYRGAGRYALQVWGR